MAKQSTNFNGGPNGSANDRRNNAANLLQLCRDLGVDPAGFVQGIASDVQQARDAMRYRVASRKRASDEWTIELRPTERDARARWYTLRDRGLQVGLQWRNDDGRWVNMEVNRA